MARTSSGRSHRESRAAAAAAAGRVSHGGALATRPWGGGDTKPSPAEKATRLHKQPRSTLPSTNMALGKGFIQDENDFPGDGRECGASSVPWFGENVMCGVRVVNVVHTCTEGREIRSESGARGTTKSCRFAFHAHSRYIAQRRVVCCSCSIDSETDPPIFGVSE